MAFIGHRCTCGHNDVNHTKNDKGKLVCTAKAGAPCGRPCKSQGEPEVMPSFAVTGRPVERIIPPGDGFRAMGDHVIVKTCYCYCDGCQALYEQLVPATA